MVDFCCLNCALTHFAVNFQKQFSFILSFYDAPTVNGEVLSRIWEVLSWFSLPGYMQRNCGG